MQRRIVIGLVVLGILFAGALFGYREYLRNQPASIWVPVPVKADLTTEQRQQVCDELKKALSGEEILSKVVKDLDLAKQWGMGSEKEAVAEVSRRLFVRPGDADTEMGRVPAIHVGVTGKGRERDLMGQLAARLMKDVLRLVGIQEPKPGNAAPPTF